MKIKISFAKVIHRKIKAEETETTFRLSAVMKMKFTVFNLTE